MRRFTKTVIAKWDRTLLPVRPALPFPGKYPTRVWIWSPNKLDYFGKPGRMAYDLWVKYRQQSRWVYTHPRIIEFDRGGVVCCMDMMSEITVQDALWKKYHGLQKPSWDGFWFLRDKKPAPKPVPHVLQFRNENRIEFIDEAGDVENVIWQVPVPNARRIARPVGRAVRRPR